jgi:AraC-like DNA-binding protein
MNTLLPEHITILAEGLTLEGHFSDGNNSDATQGISVSWDDGLIQIVCANKYIKLIILQFPSPFAGGDFKLLNDHWERSYGDLQWSADYQHRNFPWYVIGTSKEHLDQVILKPELARLCHMSTEYFIRKFITATGLTPEQYSLDRRLAEGARLLAQSNESRKK